MHSVSSRVKACAWVLLSLVGGLAPTSHAAEVAAALQADGASTGNAPALTRADLESWLDGFLAYALKEADIAGAQVLVLKDGQVLLQKGYGYADVAKRIPMDPARTLIEVASVSKTFTWTAVMQLVEEGKLDLDRDVNEYLDFQIPAEFGQPITLRHLMTHTPGFEERLKNYAVSGQPPRSLGDYLRAVPPPQRIYAPGTVQAYSNYGTLVGGYIVERISGEPFPAYIERHVLRPLGMQRSTFSRPVPQDLQADLALNYGMASKEPIPPSESQELLADPAGSLISTAEEMSRFMLAHLQQGRLGDFSMLKPETAKLMHASAYVPVPGSPGTALGFFGADYNGHRIIIHDGDGSGNHTDMQLLLDQGVGFFSFVNSDGKGGLIGASYALRASLLHHFMNRYFPAATVPQEPTASTATAHARQVAGEYEMSRRPSGDFMSALYLAARQSIRVHEDGTIETPALLNFEYDRPQRWREVGAFSWREVGGEARMGMKLEDGEVTSVLPVALSTFELKPVSVVRSAALNVPLIVAALTVLLLSVVMWPVAALVRRHYGAPLELQGRAASAHRFTRIAALIGVVFVVGWLLILMAIGSGTAEFNSALDPWIRVIQLIGLLSVAGAGVALWNAWVTCTSSRHLVAKIWSVLMALALLDLAWFSLAFGLISPELNY